MQYELFKKLPKEYSDFIEEETESKFPEIVKNIALIYNQLGMKDEAMSAVSEARNSNPEDVNLIWGLRTDDSMDANVKVVMLVAAIPDSNLDVEKKKKSSGGAVVLTCKTICYEYLFLVSSTFFCLKMTIL